MISAFALIFRTDTTAWSSWTRISASSLGFLQTKVWYTWASETCFSAFPMVSVLPPSINTHHTIADYPGRYPSARNRVLISGKTTTRGWGKSTRSLELKFATCTNALRVDFPHPSLALLENLRLRDIRSLLCCSRSRRHHRAATLSCFCL